MKAKAGKALALFFLLIVGFTILSRIADSFTVPKVEVTTRESTSLQFNFYGEGTVISDANHYISILEGVRVNQIYSGFGKTVEKGDALFGLKREDIKKKLNTIKKEEKKFQIQLEQEKLVQVSNIDSSGYENAREDYYAAQKDYNEIEKEYQFIQRKNRKELLKSKNEEYEKQKDTLELLKLESESSVADAKYAMEDAKSELDERNALENGVLAALQSYMANKDFDKAGADKALEELYLWAYDYNIERYEEHKNEVAAAEKKVERAKDTVISIRMQASLNSNVSSGIAYANSIREAENGVQDAKDEWNKLNLKEVKITAKAYEYVLFSREGNEEKALEALEELYKIIYGETAYKAYRDDDAKKTVAYERLKSVYENRKQQYQMKENECKKKLNKLEKECDSLKDGTYNFDEALKSQKEVVKTAQRTVNEAQRAFDSAEKVYADQLRSTEDERKKSQLRQESLTLDLQEKTEDRELLEKLEMKKGIVTTDISGTISQFTLEAGNITTINDIVAIGKGKLGIKGTFSKEDGEYLAIGDEVKLQLKGKNEKVSAKIESISFYNDENKGDITEISGKLEDDSYTGYASGSILNMEVVKHSDLYQVCVPISALREDAAGTFVLKVREDNSILGKVLFTEKVPVQLLEKNKNKAAVEGNLSDEDKIVSGSNKIISEGDRVRIK